MKTLKVIINGTEYPCRQTLGGMLRFKKETGKEVTAIKTDELSDMAILLWCYTKSTCNAEKVEFPYSVEDFTDALSMEVLDDFVKSSAEEKKKAQ